MIGFVRLLLILIIILKSTAVVSIAATQNSNLSSIKPPALVLDDEEQEGEEDWDDEDDEDWDDEDWDEEEDIDWEDEDDEDFQAPIKQETTPKTQTVTPPNIQTSVQKPVETPAGSNQVTEPILSPVDEKLNLNNKTVILQDEAEQFLTRTIDKPKIVTDNKLIEKLFDDYGKQLKGLNPNNPKDLKEVNKLLEIVGQPIVTKEKLKSTTVKKDDPVINFSARNISVKDAFATLARISGKSITVSGSIQDRDLISVIEINDQPFTQAFFSLVDAAGVEFNVSGDNYTILRKSGASQTRIFSLEPTDVDLSLAVLDRIADLSYDNVDLNTIIKDLANKFGIDIVMTAAPTERVTVRVRGVNIEEALRLVLSGSTFEFTKSGDKFVIYSKVNMNFGLDRKIVLFPIKHLEAKNVTNLLPQELKSIVQVAEEQNALIAEGPREELTRLYEFLRAIDKPINQVELIVKLVDASLVKTHNRNAIADSLVFGSVGLNGTGVGVNRMSFTGEDFNLLAGRPSIQQTRQNSNIKVDQRLFVASGKTAKFNFDQDRNILLNAGQATGNAVAAVQSQSISRITAGTSLSITPIVGDNGVITLKVEIEVSENSDPLPGSQSNVPATTTRRRLSTELQVIDHETISIGGLFQDKDSVNATEIPLLHRIPIIGNLLANKVRSDTDQELIVLITPHVRPTGNAEEEAYVRAEVK